MTNTIWIYVVIVLICVGVYLKYRRNYAKKVEKYENMLSTAEIFGGVVIDPNDRNAFQTAVDAVDAQHAFEDDQLAHPERYMENFLASGDLVMAQKSATALGRNLTKSELQQILKRNLRTKDYTTLHSTMKLLQIERLSYFQYLELFAERSYGTADDRFVDTIFLIFSGIRPKAVRDILAKYNWIQLTKNVRNIVALKLFLRLIDAKQLHTTLNRFPETPKQSAFELIVEELLGRTLTINENELLLICILSTSYNSVFQFAHNFAVHRLGRHLTLDDLRIYLRSQPSDQMNFVLAELREDTYLPQKIKQQFIEEVKFVRSMYSSTHL